MGQEAVTQPAKPQWISELAQLERQRRETYKITRAAATEFQKLLGAQVQYDLMSYFREFPTEAGNVDSRNEPGATIIERGKDDSSIYEGLACSVVSRLDVNDLRLDCVFTHKTGLNKSFKLAVQSDGTIGLVNETIAGLSRYLLTPVLFDKLRIDDPGNPPNGD